MNAEIGHKSLVFLLSILILIGFPILLILSAPLILFRFIVAKLAPCLRPKLKKMVTTRGCVYAADDYTNCPTCNVVTIIMLEGQVDLEKAKECAGKRLLEARFSNGDLKYPELKQYATTWMGYYFWKDDKKFDINNHIRIYQDPNGQERLKDDDLQQLMQNMLQEPWAKKRPTWDITFVPNCYPDGLKSPGPHTALINRFHHILSDGYSWSPVIVEDLCQSEVKYPLPNYPKRSFCGNILDQITFPFKASYNLADGLCIRFRRNVPFGIKERMPIGKYNIGISDRIPVKKLKEIRAHFNVCFSSVVLAILSGAMRDLLTSKQMKIPRVLHSITAQPLPGHSLKLRNYLTGGILKFPLGEEDPVKRLKYCDANYKYLQLSAQPRLFKYGFMLMGTYFSWITKYVGQNYSVTSGISNFPGPPTYSAHFNGHKWIDYMFSAGLQPGACGLAFCAISFVDGFRISSIAAKGVLSTKEVNELSALIAKHVDILHNQITTDV